MYISLHPIYAQNSSVSLGQQTIQEKSQHRQVFISARDIVFYTPKWLLKADHLKISERFSAEPNEKAFEKVSGYYAELNQVLFFPCSFQYIEQLRQASIFFEAQSIKLIQSHIFLQEPSLSLGTFKLSLPSFSLDTPHDDLGYFKLAWQNKSPWLETGIKMLPWTDWMSITPTLIYGPNTLGFGTHFTHYHQYLRTQFLAQQTVSDLKSWFIQAKGGNALYTLRGTWVSYFNETQINNPQINNLQAEASTNSKQDFSLPLSPLINSEFWQKPYAYFDSKLMLYDHPRFQSYLKYRQSRVMSKVTSQLDAAPFAESPNQSQALSQQQTLLYSHHYIDNHHSNQFDRFYVNYLSLNVQARQDLGIYHQANNHLVSPLSYNEPLLFQNPSLIHNHALSLRPSLYSAIGQTSLWAVIGYEANHDLSHEDFAPKSRQTYSAFSQQIGFEHALKLSAKYYSAKYYKSPQVSQSKPLVKPNLLAKPSPKSSSQVYLHQVYLAPRLTLSFNNSLNHNFYQYVNDSDQLEAIDQAEQVTRYGLLLKQSLSHSSYQLLLNHWLYSEATYSGQATYSEQYTNQELKLATQLRFSSRQLLIDYIHDPQRYQRVSFSISSQEKAYKSHRLSLYLSLIVHQFLGSFFDSRSAMVNQDFIPLSERILYSKPQRVGSFFLAQQSLNARGQGIQLIPQTEIGETLAEKKETLDQPFSQNLSQLSLGLSFDAFSLDVSMILAHSHLLSELVNGQQLFTQQTVLTWQSPCRCWYIKLSGLYTPLLGYNESISNLNMWTFALSAGLGEPKANVGFTPNFALDSVSH